MGGIDLTDEQLRDVAWKELQQTTVGWYKVANLPAGKLAATHWGKAKAWLDMIGKQPLDRVPIPVPASVFPDPPIAPSETRYTIPAGAVSVANQAALETELAKGTAEDIKVLNGAYTRATELAVTAAAHRVWCESATGVTFNYGFRYNNVVGWEFHGGKFNIPDLAHAATDGGFTAALLNWVGSTVCNVKISDVTIDGANLVAQGVQLGQPGGAVIQRVVVTNCTDEGLRLSDNSLTSVSVIDTITDINCSGIHRTVYGSAGGTAEAGLWVGLQVTNTVRRLKFRDIGWMGLFTGNLAYNTQYSDIDTDTGINTGNRTGIYCEHRTRFCNFDRVLFGPGCSTGMICEWDYNLNSGLNGPHTLPVGTITVKDSTAAYPGSGNIYVGSPADSIQTVAYTGKGANTFTGCTGGSGTYGDGTIVAASSEGPGGSMAWYVTLTNSRNNSADYGVFFDNGTMYPKVTGTTFTNCATAAIKDRSNNPQCTSSADSNMTQTGNTFTQRGTNISYG